MADSEAAGSPGDGGAHGHRINAARPSARVRTRRPVVARRVVLEAFCVSYAASMFFVGLQALLMSDLWWFVFPTVLLPVGLYLLLRLFVGQVLKRRLWARCAFLFVAAAHVIPVLAQLFGPTAVTVDAVILSCVSLGLATTV
jgi:hypothetical protein